MCALSSVQVLGRDTDRDSSLNLCPRLWSTWASGPPPAPPPRSPLLLCLHVLPSSSLMRSAGSPLPGPWACLGRLSSSLGCHTSPVAPSAFRLILASAKAYLARVRAAADAEVSDEDDEDVDTERGVHRDSLVAARLQSQVVSPAAWPGAPGCHSSPDVALCWLLPASSEHLNPHKELADKNVLSISSETQLCCYFQGL